MSDSVNPWTGARQAPLSMGFPRQEYWSGLSFYSPGDLPNPGMEPQSPALQADSLPLEPVGNGVLIPSFLAFTSWKAAQLWKDIGSSCTCSLEPKQALEAERPQAKKRVPTAGSCEVRVPREGEWTGLGVAPTLCLGLLVQSKSSGGVPALIVTVSMFVTIPVPASPPTVEQLQAGPNFKQV